MHKSRTETVATGTVWTAQFEGKVSLGCVSGHLWLTRGSQDIVLRPGEVIAVEAHEEIMLQALGNGQAALSILQVEPHPQPPLADRLRSLWKPRLLKTKPAPF